MEHFILVSHSPKLIRDGFAKSSVLVGVLGPKMGKFYSTSHAGFPFTANYPSHNRFRARDLFAITQACIRT